MALIYLLSAALLGAAVVRRIPFPVYAFEGVAMAVVIGFFGWTWLTFVVELVLPYDLALAIVVMVCVIASFTLWRGGNGGPRLRPLEGGRNAWIIWGVASVLIALLMMRLFWTHMLPEDNDGIWAGGAVWGDFGLHSAIISHITAADRLPMDLPIANGEKMTYPFLIDLLSAMLVHGGMSTHLALFIPGLLLTLAICQLIISFGLRLFGRISVGVGTMFFALTIGSAAGTWSFWQDYRKSDTGFWQFLTHMQNDYSILGGKNVTVSNLLTDAIMPQRSFLFGLSVGLLVLVFFHVSRETKNTKLLWPAAILVGLLPMAHPHTFIITSVVFLALGVEAAWQTRKAPLAIIKPFALAMVMALPQVLWQQRANHNGSGGHFKLFWDHQPGQSVLWFYWGNFGLVGLALLAIPFVFRKDKQRLFWFLPVLLVLFICQIYAFQPTEYDNLKLMYYAYIVGFFFIAYVISEIVRRRKAWLALIVPVTAFAVLPGVLSITRDLGLHWNFATPDDIKLANWVKANTPTDAVFAAVPNSNPPVSTLAGRKMVDGYSGWLYNFSIPYQPRDEAIKAALAGKFATAPGQTTDPALKKYGAQYVVMSTMDNDQYWKVDRAALQQHTPVFQTQLWLVYKITD